MSNLQIITEFNTRCKGCTNCGLRAGATQVVPGEGDPDADIMFIGEGPGKTEDETGRPFVGRGGKFLDELLDSIGLKREDVFIANMVKCRPPENRDPKPEEMLACKPWLDEQIKIVNPKVFVPLGRFAMSKFVPNAKISDDHGKAFKKGSKYCFLMYHPAAALYNPVLRDVMFKDIYKLKLLLDKE